MVLATSLDEAYTHKIQYILLLNATTVLRNKNTKHGDTGGKIKKNGSSLLLMDGTCDVARKRDPVLLCIQTVAGQQHP
jgi:hypothetical protein